MFTFSGKKGDHCLLAIYLAELRVVHREQMFNRNSTFKFLIVKIYKRLIIGD